MVYGGLGVDQVFGGKGKDIVSGSEYNQGDVAKDKLFGNADGDKFYFIDRFGVDTIKDLSLRKDAIYLSKTIAKNVEQVEDVAKSYKNGVMLKFSKKEIVKIEGIELDQFEKIKFKFYHSEDQF